MTIEELWDRPIQIKWMPVTIEGPRIKDWFLRKELVARLDSVFSGYLRDYQPYVKEIADTSGCPYYYFSYDILKHHIWTVEPENYDPVNELIDKWIKWWGASKWSDCDSTVFPMNTFDSSCRSCFFNPKTGKVGITHNVGKWVGNMSELKPEIEWFAEEFPEVELYLTFEDYPNQGTTDTSSTSSWYTEPFATIHLKDGKIEIVKTRRHKELKNPISHSKFYYKITNIFSQLLRNIFKRITPDRYVYWWNYKFLGNVEIAHSSRFYKPEEFLAISEWWFNECREYWKDRKDNPYNPVSETITKKSIVKE